MYLEKAKELLDKEYKAKHDIATGVGRLLIEEKIKHSYQVLGAGNLILKNEEIYKNLSDDEIDLLKATLLLHDIGRFEEAVFKDVDHGVWGAELLQKTFEFNKNTVCLAIKHHGHLIEALYEDEEYIRLDDDEKNEIKKYIFLVRDADKIANFYLLSNEFEEMEELFFRPAHLKDSCDVSDFVRNEFMNHRSINKRDVKTYAEQTLMIMACVFDINYSASFKFLDKLMIMDKLMNMCARFWNNHDSMDFKRVILEYIKNRI